MIKIGITGSTGILGKKLKKKLEKNFKVTCFTFDIRNKSKVKKWILNNNFDAVFHLAAIVPTTVCNNMPLETCEVNVGGTSNLVESMKGLKKKPWLFYASTSHVYKQKFKKNLIRETDTTSPKSFYGYTKFLGERLINHFSDQYKFDYCCGRIFSFYDKRQPNLFLYKSIKKKLEKLKKKDDNLIIDNALNIIDIQTADKVVDKIFLLFKKKAKGVFNIGTGKGISIENFAKKLTKKKIKIKTFNHKKLYSIASMRKFNSVIKK